MIAFEFIGLGLFPISLSEIVFGILVLNFALRLDSLAHFPTDGLLTSSFKSYLH